MGILKGQHISNCYVIHDTKFCINILQLLCRGVIVSRYYAKSLDKGHITLNNYLK